MKPGRKIGYRASEELRDKIRNSNVITALIQHAAGDREMRPSQVTAGVALMKKILPDLQATELSDPNGNAIQPAVVVIQGASADDEYEH